MKPKNGIVQIDQMYYFMYFFLYYSHNSFLMSEIDWFEHATRILLKYSSTFIVIGSLMWYTVKSTPFLQKEY